MNAKKRHSEIIKRDFLKDGPPQKEEEPKSFTRIEPNGKTKKVEIKNQKSKENGK